MENPILNPMFWPIGLLVIALAIGVGKAAYWLLSRLLQKPEPVSKPEVLSFREGCIRYVAVLIGVVTLVLLCGMIDSVPSMFR